MQRITVLGATGSIGQSTLDVIARHPDRYQVFALTAQTRVEELAALCQRFRPRYAVVGRAEDGVRLRERLANGRTEVLVGGTRWRLSPPMPIATRSWRPLSALPVCCPPWRRCGPGKKCCWPTRKSLVMAGSLFMAAVREHGATLLPIDSEHNAIFQCLPAGQSGLAHGGVEKILLTASGGPFRLLAEDQLQDVTPEQACKHPNWSMGRKISVDSATLMNKGLEFIEACWLFDARPDQIEVLVHPQSIIHSLVQYVDGSTLAQLGNPDMRTPIAHALAWPERIPAGVARLDLTRHVLDFQAPDEARFPCLRLAREAMEAGGTAPAILNAANEVAVAAFLDRQISFRAIPGVIERVLTQLPMSPARQSGHNPRR
jgi:1-deoxy-D-xylulose-5-phosphate reductoisomerase